ncbi:SDR family NAD(P)-dependent oxidoreductase [Oceanidesulfovibrio marinus]|uniref:SDR family oxidoreductase n=1 Tax=Oceanidesulfovibrio marinus TaxID=370038 RepID=A0ABX6NHD7_9BACT|nr:SDR family oxidoreductase [Oceanidesulfovibrio marinus]QJT09473.1 SDR family oxidoreductase [Oceanidesulfovibrio marinus]
MQIDLTGKTAIVTGSTAGIGLATATGLARAGARVIVTGRTQSAVDKALQQIRTEVPAADAEGFPGDLGTAAGCDALVQAHPTCDILVNNLGVITLLDFFETPDSEWERIFQINIMTGVRLSRAYAQKMADNGWGRIVFLSSESGLNIPADTIHYGFTKTAVMSIARGLAKRLAGTGVTVNSVLPGPTMSKGLSVLIEEQRAEGQTMEEAGKNFVMQERPTSIIQRLATVEEVANMIVYACSKEASATTGAALRVDGGVVDTIA